MRGKATKASITAALLLLLAFHAGITLGADEPVPPAVETLSGADVVRAAHASKIRAGR
jgi:hypothetical protein